MNIAKKGRHICRLLAQTECRRLNCSQSECDESMCECMLNLRQYDTSNANQNIEITRFYFRWRPPFQPNSQK